MPKDELRERAAIAAMQALAAKGGKPEEVAANAVKLADLLIAELEKKGEPAKKPKKTTRAEVV